MTPGRSSERDERIRRGRVWAEHEAAQPWSPERVEAGAARPVEPARLFALGDPQSSLDRVLEILDRWDLLGEDGRLAPDAGLLSVGDHFDYSGDADDVSREGTLVLRWLAGHPPGQVVLLAGNHDLSRVMELALVSDAAFAAARRRALEIHRLVSPPDGGARDDAALARARQEYFRDFAGLPAPRLVRRDLAGFRESQRQLVQELLLAGRMRLGCAARVAFDGGPGRAALFTHAAVTVRDCAAAGIGDVAALGLSEDSAAALAARRLDGFLFEAVERARPAWRAGRLEAVDLSPLLLPPQADRQGGGLLYHRPANPDAVDPRSEDAQLFEGRSDAPRRFDPRRLPAGLLQACGHVGHRKSLGDLRGWVAQSARAIPEGGLRTLRTDGRRVVYEAGIHEPAPGEIALFFVDGEMNRVDPATYPLLPLAGWDPLSEKVPGTFSFRRFR